MLGDQHYHWNFLPLWRSLLSHHSNSASVQINFEKMARFLWKCSLTKQLPFVSSIHCVNISYWTTCIKEKTPLKYEVNKYEKFSLFITIVTDHLCEGRRFCLAFILFYILFYSMYGKVFFLHNSFKILKHILRSSSLFRFSCLDCLLSQWYHQRMRDVSISSRRKSFSNALSIFLLFHFLTPNILPKNALSGWSQISAQPLGYVSEARTHIA